MNRFSIGSLAIVASLFLGSEARAQWSDDFDSYPLNSTLIQVSTWEEWDNITNQTLTKVKDATKAAARSAPHCIWVRGSSDTIHQFGVGQGGGPYTSGAWTLSCYQYAPVTTTSFQCTVPTNYILMNEYAHGAGSKNWSMTLNVNPIAGTYTVQNSTTSYSGPAVFDAWAEIRAEIDLDGDTIELFYNGSSTGPAWPWNGGQSGYGTGSNEIAAIDLWAAGSTSPLSRVYYDDFKIEAAGGGCSSAPSSYCTAGLSAAGCTANLSASGTSSATAASGFVIQASSVEGGNKSGLLYWGTAQKSPATAVGTSSSFQCVNPPVKRSQLLDSGGTNGTCDGTFSVDLNARWAAQPAQNPGAGATVYAQLWFRDPANTSNQTTSRSDALSWSVCP